MRRLLTPSRKNWKPLGAKTFQPHYAHAILRFFTGFALHVGATRSSLIIAIAIIALCVPHDYQPDGQKTCNGGFDHYNSLNMWC